MDGLSQVEVDSLRARFGPNELVRDQRTPWWHVLARQLRSPLIALIVGAAAISFAIGERLDALAIAVIVILDAGIGFAQETRAETAILALRSLTSPRARVVRDGRHTSISARDIVPGDLLVLEAGDLVAADATLVEATALTTNEASLTGESAAVDKSSGGDDASIFMGTSVLTGTGRARVTATGMATELGRIASLLVSPHQTETPLQQRLAVVGRLLLWASVGIVVCVGASELARGEGLVDVVMSAVSLAVAAVPEGLPAIVSIALAVGVRRMSAHHALVRKLTAVETLGCATVICSDKTGTLTTGVMTVRDIWTTDRVRLLDAAAACCDADLDSGLGDSTELAVLAEAARIGISTATIERTRPRVEVEPFDPATKRMLVRRADGIVYAKGAVEVMVAAERTEIHAAATRMAAAGLRVLAIARGPDIGALEVLGLIGIADAPRSEVVEAIRTAHEAGIKTVMITGDHVLTARAIASELGLARDGESLEHVVFARTTPQQKLEIVRDLVARGEIVAMTGDGVNDAPALREAHVGIAMGKIGTEVAREVSAIVLADDNFATIVAAVREGRAIFDNIRKALVYLLAGNVAELAIMLIGSLAGLPLPLLPLQLLWINLITDGLPALALVVDPPASDIMTRPPRPPREPILRATEWRLIAMSATLEAGVTLASYVWALDHGGVERARALAFAVLVASELLRAFAFRSRSRVLWSVGAFGNLTLIAIVVGSLLAQLVVLYVPSVRAVIAGGVLSASDGVLALGFGLVPVTVLELVKLVVPGTWLAERRV